MKYFLYAFCSMIIFGYSMDSKAYEIINHFYSTQSQAQTACVAFQNTAPDGLYYVRNCYEYSTRGVVGNSSVRHYWMTNDNRPCPLFTDPLTGECLAEKPPVVCPESGTKEPKFHLVKKYAGESRILNNSKTFSVNGCDVNQVVNESVMQCYKSTAPLATCGVIATYEYTGNATTAPEVNNSIDDIIDIKPDSQPLIDGDHTSDSSDTSIGDVSVVDIGNGVSVATKIDVQTDLVGKGVEILTDSSGRRILENEGINKVVTTTTETTTNSDGSKSVKTSVNTSYTQNDRSIVRLVNDTGVVSYTDVTGSSGSQNVVTTDTYNPSGEKTSSSTSTTNGGGDGEGGEGGEGGECKTDSKSINCLDFNPTGEKGSFDLAGIQSEIDAEISNVKNQFQLVRDDAKQYFNVSLTGTKTPQCIDFFDFNGEQRPICLGDFSGALEPLKAFILFMGFFIALFIILR